MLEKAKDNVLYLYLYLYLFVKVVVAVYGIWYAVFVMRCDLLFVMRYIYIVVSALSKKLPSWAAEVRFLYFFRHCGRGFDPVPVPVPVPINNFDSYTDNRQNIYIDRQSTTKLPFKSNQSIHFLVLSAPLKTLSNKGTTKPPLASLLCAFIFNLY